MDQHRRNKRKPIEINSTSTELADAKTNNKLYRNNGDNSGKIAEMIENRMMILNSVIQRGKTDLKDLDEVKAVSIAYLESCRNADCLPTFEGLCTAMGFSRQWVYAYMKSKSSEDPVVEYLDELRTMFADMMTQASLKRYVDCATTIFSLKNMTGLGYSDKGDAIPETASAQYDIEHDVKFYREKYGDLIEE